MKIRSATSADVPFLLELADSSPGAARWTEKQYLHLLEDGSNASDWLVLVAESSVSATDQGPCEIVGFLVARHIAGEWELENVVVAETARRKGLGKRLLETLLAAARQTNSTAVFLEVRESNSAARSLYEKSGFRRMARRTAYYVNPSEDAIVYRNDLA